MLRRRSSLKVRWRVSLVKHVTLFSPDPPLACRTKWHSIRKNEASLHTFPWTASANKFPGGLISLLALHHADILHKDWKHTFLILLLVVKQGIQRLTSYLAPWQSNQKKEKWCNNAANQMWVRALNPWYLHSRSVVKYTWRQGWQQATSVEEGSSHGCNVLICITLHLLQERRRGSGRKHSPQCKWDTKQVSASDCLDCWWREGDMWCLERGWFQMLGVLLSESWWLLTW